MKFDITFLGRVRLQRSVLLLLALLGTAGYASYEAFGHSGGMTGVTQRGSTPGCTCHCASASSGTTVSLSTSATTFVAGSSYTFTASVSNSGESDAGIDIAVWNGSLSAISGQGLYASSNELTHSAPKSLPASWSFTYTAPATPGFDTIYATGNAVNGDGLNGGGNCTDNWNHSAKYVIQVVSGGGTKTLGVGRTTINLGALRVGRRTADSLILRSTGTASLTVNSTSLKNGAPFSTYPSGTNRTITAGSTEMDSVIFQPTSRGSFTDSLIVSTNGDSPSDQRKAIYVTGQGIQAVFGGLTTPIAFNNVRTGRTVRSTYQIQNTGDDTLFMQSPSISGSGFSIATAPSRLTLAPNERDSVVVQFAPTAKQSYSGTLTFSATGITAPTISLSGTGVAPQLTATNSAGLGGTRVGQGLQGTITIRNSGTDTLHVSGATLTQTGSKFSLGTYDNAILPNTNGIFHLSYSPTSERTDSATLTFNTDDAANPTYTIRVTASGIAPHMSVVDKDTVNMGQIKVGTSVTRDFGINNTGTDGLNLFSVIVSPAPQFTLVSKESSVGSGSTGYATIKFTATAVGDFTGIVVVNGDDAANSSDTIYVKGSGINSALSVPASLDFNSSNVGQKVQQNLTLQNTGAAAVKILGYKLISSTGAFGIVDTSAHTVNPNGSAQITLSFTPAAAVGYAGTLQITTDDASTPVRTVNLSGRGIKGALSLSASTIDFGALDTGKTATQNVVIRNTGSAPVSISGFTATGSNDFSIISTVPIVIPPFTINADDSVVATIQFKPTIVGPIAASITFTTSDNSTSTLQLSGAGLAVPTGAVGVEQKIRQSISISPNPASSLVGLTIQTAKGGIAEIKLFDMTGHVMLTSPVGTLSEGSQKVELNIGALPSGSYFVRVTTSNGESLDGRIVIEH